MTYIVEENNQPVFLAKNKIGALRGARAINNTLSEVTISRFTPNRSKNLIRKSVLASSNIGEGKLKLGPEYKEW